MAGNDIVSEIESSKERHRLLVAAAGSGKTRTLIHLLARLIRNGRIDPLASEQEVVVFTFTNKAAEELVVRLSKLLGQGSQHLNAMFVGTIHGWCNDFLKSRGSLASTKVLDELERTQLIQRVYPVLRLNEAYEGVNMFQKIEKFEKDLELFYNENLRIDDGRIPEEIRPVLDRYMEFTRSERLVDFGSLIRNAITELDSEEDSRIARHVFVDEYQDVNPAQVELIQLLVGGNSRSTLFAVGDPRQSIYQWRGSDVSRILRFTEDFPQSEIFDLSMNHRSRTGIVQFANIIAEDMAFDSEFESEDMEPSPSRRDARVSVVSDTSSKDHENRVVRAIAKLHSDGVDYSSMAILLRSVIFHGRNLMQRLDNEGVPYYSPNRNSGTALVEEFMLSVIQLLRIMSEDFIPRNREEEEEHREEIDRHLVNVKRHCGEEDTGSIHVAVSDWFERLSNPISVRRGDGHAVYANESYNFRRQFFDFCDAVDLRLRPEEIESQEGFSAITQVMRAVEEIYRRRFQGLGYIRPAPIEVLTRNIAWQLGHQIERWTEVGMDFTRQDRLVLSTVHAAKGLQWPVVFAPFLWTGTFPLNDRGHDTSFDDEVAGRYRTTREDEKRLWYVAATRARDHLYLFSGCHENQHPSPFTYRDKLSEHADVIAIVTSQQDTDALELSDAVAHSEETYSHVGVSDLLLLLECPYHFHLRRTKGVNVPVGEELGAGDILHKVIERISVSETSPSVDDIVDEEVYLPLAEYSLQEKVRKSIKKKANRLVRSGILENVDQTEYPFTLGIHNLVVSGIVDATRATNQGMEIVDWKSSVHPEFMHRYENQIKIYAHALRTLGFDVGYGTIYDLSEKDIEKSSIKVDVSETNVAALLEELEQAVAALFDMPPSPSPSVESCGKCDVKEICPSRHRV